jgi:hypothetical protein
VRVVDARAARRIVYRVDLDAIVIAEVSAKKTAQTPHRVLETCLQRLREYDEASRKEVQTRGEGLEGRNGPRAPRTFRRRGSLRRALSAARGRSDVLQRHAATSRYGRMTAWARLAAAMRLSHRSAAFLAAAVVVMGARGARGECVPERNVLREVWVRSVAGQLWTPASLPDGKTPIANVTVELGEQWSAATDEKGYFHFVGVPEGTYGLCWHGLGLYAGICVLVHVNHSFPERLLAMRPQFG